MESIGCLYYNYTFLAPLSDPIFGAQNAPEPKRKENHGFGMFLLLKYYTCLAPLWDPIFGFETAPEPKREENHGILSIYLDMC